MWLSEQIPIWFATKLNIILLPQFTDKLNIYPSPMYQVLSFNWFVFLKGICLPSKVTAETVALMEDAIWAVGTWVCFHWLCGPLVCYWPLCRCDGSHGVSQIIFATSHVTHPTPPHPLSLLAILTIEKDGKNTMKFSHQNKDYLYWKQMDN